MAKKCPPGVLCLENFTLGVLILCLGIVLYFLYIRDKSSNKLSSNTVSNNEIIIREIDNHYDTRNTSGLFPMPSYSYSNIPDDVLMNPYQPPLRDDRVFNNIRGGDPRGMPINVPTQSVDTTYRQVGILTRINGPETILPLMGRPLFTNRDKWNFYTMSDKNNMIKLPVVNRNKSCTGEYGCDNLQNGDTVYVEGYNDAFKVTSYDNNQFRYIPYV